MTAKSSLFHPDLESQCCDNVFVPFLLWGVNYMQFLNADFIYYWKMVTGSNLPNPMWKRHCPLNLSDCATLG